MSWSSDVLGAVVKRGGGAIQTGPFGSQLHQADYTPDGVPVIMPKDIREGRVSTETVAMVSEPTAVRLKRHRLAPRTIVLPRRGEVTKRAFIREDQRGWLCGTGCLQIVLGGSELHPEFLYYFMEQQEVARWLEQHAVGTTMLNLSAGIVADLPLRYPEAASQGRIAGILATYDDLIENNRRRLALLEDAARQVYREWFVRLRFPGHEHTRVVDGVPEGWSSWRVDEICDVGRGASPRPIAAFMGGDIPWFKIGDATGSESPFVLRTEEQVTDKGAEKSVALEAGALILSNSATCGIPFFTGVPGCIHDGWLYFTCLKRVSERFLYCFLHFKKDELVSSVSDGSTQKNLNTSAVSRLVMLLPDNDRLLGHFEETVQPMFSQALNLAGQNQKLRAARDLLLPRLMSGEITV